jgi:hypothetical protein
MYWRPEREASAFATENGPRRTLFLPSFHPRLALSATAQCRAVAFTPFMQIAAFRAGKPVKSARIGCRFRVLREWNKGEVYSQDCVCATQGRQRWIKPRHSTLISRTSAVFFHSPRRLRWTDYAVCALGNQKALLVKLGRLF